MSDELKHKLLDWKVQPPVEAWRNIEASLESDQEYTLSQKLNHFQNEPPPNVWSTINARMKNEKHSSAPSAFMRYKKLLFYSSVAVVLIFAILLVNRGLQKNNSEGQTMELAQERKIATTKKDEPLAYQKPGSTSSVPKANPVEADNKNTHLLQSKPAKTHKTGLPILSTGPETPGKQLALVLPGDEFIVKIDVLDRYVILSKNTGDEVKLSKKLYDTFSCSGFINERNCKEQIVSLQQKAALSPLTASADFAGILEILSSMQENP